MSFNIGYVCVCCESVSGIIFECYMFGYIKQTRNYRTKLWCCGGNSETNLKQKRFRLIFFFHITHFFKKKTLSIRCDSAIHS